MDKSYCVGVGVDTDVFFNLCLRFCNQVAFGIVCTFDNVKIATCFFGD